MERQQSFLLRTLLGPNGNKLTFLWDAGDLIAAKSRLKWPACPGSWSPAVGASTDASGNTPAMRPLTMRARCSLS
jgi:hypothetical protein